MFIKMSSELFEKTSIDTGVSRFRAAEGSVLLDVRTPEEYRNGHIPGSLNIPLDDIRNILSIISDRDTLLFVHCRSGMRSGKAVAALKKLGYKNALNIGGILDYHGALEKD